eukprot:scaffold138106_cov21-Prasinocladus_malaysianus.AAC.1
MAWHSTPLYNAMERCTTQRLIICVHGWAHEIMSRLASADGVHVDIMVHSRTVTTIVLLTQCILYDYLIRCHISPKKQS